MNTTVYLDGSRPYYRANFHTHTTNSDGRVTPAECMRRYREQGYDILAITDHRKITEVTDAPEGLLTVPGTELDFMLPGQAVHLLALGAGPELISRWQSRGTPQQAIDDIRACGGIAVLAHPAWSLNDTSTMAAFRGLAAVEIWNSVSAPPYNADRADSSALLDSLWSNAPGSLLPVMANDDTHFYGSEIFNGWNMVQCDELTVPSVLDAVAAGRFYATQGPEIHSFLREGNSLIVTCSPAERVIFYSNAPWIAGRSRIAPAQTSAVYTLSPGERFVRVEITDADGRKAWSRPVAVERE